MSIPSRSIPSRRTYTRAAKTKAYEAIKVILTSEEDDDNLLYNLTNITCSIPQNQSIYQALLEKASSYPSNAPEVKKYKKAAEIIANYNSNICSEFAKYCSFEITPPGIDDNIEEFIYQHIKDHSSQPIASSNWSLQATDQARLIAAKNAPKNTTVWPDDDAQKTAFRARVEASNAPVKKTPNTLFMISTGDKIKYNAYNKYVTEFKDAHINNITNYLDAYNADDKYYIMPELLKYLIANPSFIMYNTVFAKTVCNKMLQLESEIETAKKIGAYTITEGYRKELRCLIKILKKITSIYSTLNMDEESFYDNIESKLSFC